MAICLAKHAVQVKGEKMSIGNLYCQQRENASNGQGKGNQSRTISGCKHLDLTDEGVHAPLHERGKQLVHLLMIRGQYLQ